MAQERVDIRDLPMIPDARVAILRSKWYPDIVGAMHSKCEQLLLKRGAVVETHVLPGTLEFPYAAQVLAENDFDLEAIICLSVVVKGETKHFEMIVESCVQGLTRVAQNSLIVVINEILPVTDIRHAQARASDDQFNKGIEAAAAAIEMIDWTRRYAPGISDDTVDFH